jgi:Rrf2 family protein
MKLSRKSDYALRGLVYIALHESDGLVRLKDLAKEENIPFKFLEGILRELANVGILRSKRGAGGGYVLNRLANQITLGQVFRLMDGPLAPINCVSKTAYAPCDCPNEATCGLRSVMQDVRDSIAEIVDRTTLADVCERTRRMTAEESKRLACAF